MKVWQKGWIFFLIMTGWVGRAWGDDYTCRRVREGQNRKAFWFTVQTKEEARKALLQYQEKLWKETVEQGWEGTAAGLKNAFYWLEKRGLLDCETKLEVIRRDLEFYNQHPDLLLGTYPWSVAGLPCARNWLKKELQRKDVSRLYHAWLIVEASRVWYEPYRDSLFKIILDTTYPREIRIDAIVSLRDTSDTTLNFLLYLLTTPEMETVESLRNELGSIQHEALIMLKHLRKANEVVPESIRMYYRRKVEKEVWSYPKRVASVSVAYYFPYHRKFNGYLPAWFAFWKQAIVRFAPALNEGEIVYIVDPSTCQDNSAMGCYRGSRSIGVTALAGGMGNQYGVGPLYKGIDLMGVVVFHELGHRNVADLWLEYEGEDPDTVDTDGDGIPDEKESQGIWVGLGTFRPHALLYQSDTTKPKTHKFYHVPFDDQEIYAMLQGCVWEEGMADTLDWSWGEYAKQMDVQLAPVPSPPDFQIVHPVENATDLDAAFITGHLDRRGSTVRGVCIMINEVPMFQQGGVL